MNPTAYLQLEQNLRLRLRKSWGKLAAKMHAQLDTLIKKGDFEAARELVEGFDLSSVAEDNREYIKYTLWGFAVLGAAEVSDKPAIEGMQFSKTLNHVTQSTVASLALHANAYVKQQAMQLIANAEAEPDVAKKDERGRYVTDFVSFANTGDEAMQLVSSLHSSRLAVWGFTAEASLYNLTNYQLSSVIDGRTSEFCRLINGRTFAVADATSSINTILQAQDPEDLRTLQPWPSQTKAGLEEFASLSTEEIVSRNWHIPPFHPGCRTMLVRLRKDKPKPKQIVVQPEEATVAYRAREKDFKELGVSISPENLEYWNTHVAKEPAQVLALLSGVSPLEMLEGYLAGKMPIKFSKNGMITFKAKTRSVVSDAQAHFDPLTRQFHMTYAEASTKDVKAAVAFFKEIHENMLTTAAAVEAGVFTVEAAGNAGIYTYAKLDFLPSQKDWFKLKGDLLVSVAEYEDALGADAYQVVTQILQNPKPEALKALVQLPYRYKGQQIGKVLLSGNSVEMGVKVGQA